MTVSVPIKRRELMWSDPTMSRYDPRISDSDLEVQRILNLGRVAYLMPDSFTDIAKVTRSIILAANVPARLEVPTRGTLPAAPWRLGLDRC